MTDSQSVADFLAGSHPTAFSFEILPPIRGNSISDTYRNLKKLIDFNPAYINITTHRNEISYSHIGGGTFREVTSQRRPGTVAVAAAIRERFGVRPVPHIICGDYSPSEIEDQLIDLSYLGINDIFVLRGDKERHASHFTSHPDGHLHADALSRQVVDFNSGSMVDGRQAKALHTPFSFGVAGYPEKHDEAMNMAHDLQNLKKKVEAGASYIVTQMFFDNQKYFEFVDACRKAGINVPIVPGIKPLTSLRQLALLPRIFHIDFPEELSDELLRCTTDEQVRLLGIEWGVRQAQELRAANVPSIHFYAMHATDSVAEIAKRTY